MSWERYRLRASSTGGADATEAEQDGDGRWERAGDAGQVSVGVSRCTEHGVEYIHASFAASTCSSTPSACLAPSIAAARTPSLHALLLDRADAGSRLETGCSDASRCLLLLQNCTLFPAGSTCFPFSGCLAAAAALKAVLLLLLLACLCLTLPCMAGWLAGGLDGGRVQRREALSCIVALLLLDCPALPILALTLFQVCFYLVISQLCAG